MVRAGVPLHVRMTRNDDGRIDRVDSVDLGKTYRALVCQRWQSVASRAKGDLIADIMDVLQTRPLQGMLDLVDQRRSNPAGQDDQEQEGG